MMDDSEAQSTNLGRGREGGGMQRREREREGGERRERGREREGREGVNTHHNSCVVYS